MQEDVVEIPELDINLRTQQFKKQSARAKRFYLAGAYFLPVISFAILVYDFSWTTLFYFVLFCSNSLIYYGIATNRDPYKYILGKSYLKINAHALELKKLFKKPVALQWKEVQELQVKLFAAEATLKNGRKLSFSLEELSDDNLKLVKEQLNTIKNVYQL